MKHGIRQVDLAALIGYDQTYISAVESGLKGPPTDEFVCKLGQALALTPQELSELQIAADASQRKLVVDLDTPEDAYWLLKDLRDNFPTLSSTQIRVIRDVLRLSSDDGKAASEPVRRMKRRSRLEATM
jgi:transcriptional regulator with XRE-family HTH domain